MAVLASRERTFPQRFWQALDQSSEQAALLATLLAVGVVVWGGGLASGLALLSGCGSLFLVRAALTTYEDPLIGARLYGSIALLAVLVSLPMWRHGRPLVAIVSVLLVLAAGLLWARHERRAGDQRFLAALLAEDVP